MDRRSRTAKILDMIAVRSDEVADDCFNPNTSRIDESALPLSTGLSSKTYTVLQNVPLITGNTDIDGNDITKILDSGSNDTVGVENFHQAENIGAHNTGSLNDEFVEGTSDVPTDGDDCTGRSTTFDMDGTIPESANRRELSNDDSSLEDDFSESEYVPSDDEIHQETQKSPEKPKCKGLQNKTSKENIGITATSGDNQQNDGSEEESKAGPSVFIRESKKDSCGRRQRTKLHCCYYCSKLYKEVTKHLQKMHSSEMEVAKLMAMEAGIEERRKGFIRLARFGDYYHNLEVLKSKDGELILARIPTPEEKVNYSFEDYGPCPDCLAFMLKKHIWHHLKCSCVEKEKRPSGVNLRRQVISESTALLANTFSDVPMPSDFVKFIASALKNDNVSMVCRQDPLIMKVGIMQFEKYHNTQNELIRQTMRQLGRLLIELRNINPDNNYLSDWLKPLHFDSMIDAVKNICKVKFVTKSRPQFSVPSLALKLGHGIKKCIAIQKGIFLRKMDPHGVETLNGLLSLIDLEWCIKISSSALATLSTRKMNSTELLPLTDDLVKLNEFLNEQLREAKLSLKRCSDYKNWSTLASVTLCKIVLFNKRRSGEASKLTVHQYSSRPTWSHSCAKEFQNTFSPLELQLASRLTIVQIRGKRDRTVNVLLTAEVKEAVDILLMHRVKFVSHENPYVFARSDPSVENIRGHDCIRNFTLAADLKQPELINATKLRKYIATVCQVFDLTENETDWLARHLGHDIRVHRDFYRLHDSSIELTKVSRLLLAVEKGQAKKFSGKKLEEINICDGPPPNTNIIEDLNIQKHFHLPDLEDEDSENDNERPEDETAESSLSTKQPNNQAVRPSRAVLSTTKKTIQRTKKPCIRRPWSHPETQTVLDFFRDYVKKNNSPPGKELCMQCLEANENLRSRTWKDIKYFIYNYMKKIKHLAK